MLKKEEMSPPAPPPAILAPYRLRGFQTPPTGCQCEHVPVRFISHERVYRILGCGGIEFKMRSLAVKNILLSWQDLAACLAKNVTAWRKGSGSLVLNFVLCILTNGERFDVAI